MAIAPLILLAAWLSPGDLPRQHADSPRAVEVCLAPGSGVATLPSLVADHRRVPFEPGGEVPERIRRERATEEQEEEANPALGWLAWCSPWWHVLSTTNHSRPDGSPLPGGKVLPRLLPSLRC
jgi:hypothetical protein